MCVISPLSIVNLILWLMSSVSVIAASVRVSIDKCNPLNIVADMMIILVSTHNKVLLSLLEAEVPNWLGTFTTDVDVSKVLFRLTVRALLVSKAWQGGTFLDVDSLHRLDIRRVCDGSYAIQTIVDLWAILKNQLRVRNRMRRWAN